MKDHIRFLIVSAAVMLLLPAGVAQSVSDAVPEAAPAVSADAETAYHILQTETGDVLEIPLREYLIGAVGAEMPASYEPEALKAQAIVCHTYAERIRRQQAQSPDPKLQGADLSDDSSSYQAFYTTDQLRTLYGDSFDAYYGKIAATVDAVSGLLLCYEDEPIAAAFHAVSSGQTENAEDVWGTALPYLISVPSPADESAPQYAETVTLSPETVQKALQAVNSAVTFPDDPAQWFQITETGASGTVLHITGGSLPWTGQQIRDALALRSACFTVSYADGQFSFATKGYGHNVGMSQYGANAMAQSGSSFDDILLHYYPGTVVQTAEST